MHLSRRLPRDQSVYKHCGTTGVKRFVTRLFQNVRIGLVAIQQMAFKSASVSIGLLPMHNIGKVR